MKKQLTANDKLIQVRGQHYVVSKCSHDCPPYCTCMGQQIASVNYWEGMGDSYEFRYVIDKRMVSGHSGAEMHPGIDMREYCHRPSDSYSDHIRSDAESLVVYRKAAEECETCGDSLEWIDRDAGVCANCQINNAREMPDTEDWINDPVEAAARAEAEFETACEFGRERGECGICGDTLSNADREIGVCYDDYLEFMFEEPDYESA